MAQTQTDALSAESAWVATPPDRPARAAPLPRVLRVETGRNDPREMTNDLFVTLLDYRVYDSVPRAWRALEQALRFDFYLAWRARQEASKYDIVWAGSEKVALPLTLLGVPKPLVVTLHFPQSPARARLFRLLNVAQRWAALGYISAADHEFFITQLAFPPARLFPIQGIKLGKFVPAPQARAESILSIGVTKRDYQTLISALETLPGYETEIFASSRFGDTFRGSTPGAIPEWVHFRERVSDQELIARYQHARFVVVTLEDTLQSSAGINVILEASACGKAVIATRSEGTPTYLVDGETGILVPPNDVPALRAAMEKLWTDPELARDMGAKGRRFVEQKFHPKVIADGVRAMLQQVYNQARRG